MVAGDFKVNVNANADDNTNSIIANVISVVEGFKKEGNELFQKVSDNITWDYVCECIVKLNKIPTASYMFALICRIHVYVFVINMIIPCHAMP